MALLLSGGASAKLLIGGGPLPATPVDLLASCLATAPAGSWTDLGTCPGAGQAHMLSVSWNCTTAPCPGNGPLASAIAGTQGPNTIMGGGGFPSTWNGGFLDTDDEWLISHGGGHQGYYGNEVYAFNLKTLSWSRINVPSSITGWTQANCTLPDGNPASAHNYDLWAYLPGTGALKAGDAFCTDIAGSDNISRIFKPSAQNPNAVGVWTTKATVPGGLLGSSGIGGGVTAYDPVSGKVFFAAISANIGTYTPLTDTWAGPLNGVTQWPDIQLTADIDTADNLMVGAGRSFLAVANMATGVITQPTVTGPTTCQAPNGPGFVWYPLAKQFVCWVGGQTLYLFNPLTNTWTSHAASGASPPATIDSDGLYGRFRYDPQHNAFLLWNAGDQDVFAWKPDIGACPVGSPSPDGSFITPPAFCSVTDIAGNVWNFPAGGGFDSFGNGLVNLNGTAFTHTAEVKINLTGNLYFQYQALYSPWRIWARMNQGSGEFYQVVDSNSGLPAKTLLNSSTGTTYQSVRDMVSAAAANQTLTAHVMTAGIPAYVDFGTFAVNGLTLNCDAGAIIGATNGAGPGQGAFAIEANSATINGCEIAYAQASPGQGPFAGIQVDRTFTGFTATNLNVHDNDHGLQSGGNNGTITVTNSTFTHNGCNGCDNAGVGHEHNVYLSWNSDSPDNTTVTFTGGGSFNVTGDGDDLKFRLSAGTIKGTQVGCKTAGNEGTIFGCWENWPVDIGCGGSYTLGAAGAGNGIVIERSLGAVKSHLVSFAEDEPNTLVCPATPRAGQSLVITNAILIDDGPQGDGGTTVVVSNPQAHSVTVSNSKLVCGPHSNCASIAAFLGTNVTDGGGNTLFASRAAASIAAYPALPAVP